MKENLGFLTSRIVEVLLIIILEVLRLFGNSNELKRLFFGEVIISVVFLPSFFSKVHSEETSFWYQIVKELHSPVVDLSPVSAVGIV